MRRRPQLIPWKAAGRVTEEQASADEVVQATGWVFNNETGDTLTLAEFVATGDSEVADLHRPLRARRRRGGAAQARRDRLRHRAHDVRVHAPVRHRRRLRPRRRLPRAVPRGRRPLRPRRAVAHRGGRRRAHAAHRGRLGRRRVQLHHAAALRARRRPRPRRRGPAGGAPRRPGGPQLPLVVGVRPVRPAGRRGRPRPVPGARHRSVADPQALRHPPRLAGQPARSAPGHRTRSSTA